jgi:hypothetical protein
MLRSSAALFGAALTQINRVLGVMSWKVVSEWAAKGWLAG